MKPGLLVILVLCYSMVFAQTEKGRYLVGGSTDISTVSRGGITNFNMNIGPHFGILVVNNFAVGGFYSFGVATNRTYNAGKGEFVTSTTFTTGIGPELSYFIGKKTLKGLVRATGGYRVYTHMRKGDIVNKNGFTAGGWLGMAYFFNRHVSLNAGAYTSLSGYEGDLPTLQIGFSVGFSVLLDKKKQE